MKIEFMEERIILTEPFPEKAKEFILNIFPAFNIKYDIHKEVEKFLGNSDYKEYREIRDSLIHNNLILDRDKQNNEVYVLTKKGVDYIKQENKDWKNIKF
jgi:hypothetical protein